MGVEHCAMRTYGLPAASDSTSEAHSKIQSGRPLCQSVALIIRQTSSLMQCEPIILHDAQLHRRIESVTEPVPERKKRIDVPARGSQLRSIGVAMKIPIHRSTG